VEKTDPSTPAKLPAPSKPQKSLAPQQQQKQPAQQQKQQPTQMADQPPSMLPAPAHAAPSPQTFAQKLAAPGWQTASRKKPPAQPMLMENHLLMPKTCGHPMWNMLCYCTQKDLDGMTIGIYTRVNGIKGLLTDGPLDSGVQVSVPVSYNGKIKVKVL